MALMITTGQVQQLADRYGVSGKNVEIAALQNHIIPERYIRNFSTYTTKDQIRLLRSQVTIVGLGGLGGIVTEYLARAGVGHLNLVDGDKFEDHNLNRQILCTLDQLGIGKAKTAAERVRQTNASLTVRAYSDYLNADNAGDLLNGAHVVADCLDTISSRFMLQAAAQKADIPLVSAAVAGLCGHITTIFPNDPGFESIYGPPDQHTAARGAEIHMGCLAQAVGLIAAAQSAEMIKVLLGQPALRHQILMVDIPSNRYEVLKLE